MSRSMTIAAVLVVVVVVSMLALIWTLQRRLIYFPTADVPTTEAIGRTDIEPVSFETVDGIRLNGWFFAVEGPLPRMTVVVFNGNAGNRAHRLPLAAALHRRGLQVLLVDYRGYGGNPGTPSQKGLAADSRAARAFLVERPDVDSSRLVYFGESLGTAVAVDLAVEHPPAALVLRSPFTSLSDVGQYHYPFLPVRLLLRDRFAPIEQIPQSRAPTLVIAGGGDRIVPVESSRRVYEAATSPKTFLLIPEADHNDYELFVGDEMIEAIVRFLQQLDIANS
jgi:fermentation-respiration switch protein FrsA (DUF1100 family)